MPPVPPYTVTDEVMAARTAAAAAGSGPIPYMSGDDSGSLSWTPSPRRTYTQTPQYGGRTYSPNSQHSRTPSSLSQETLSTERLMIQATLDNEHFAVVNVTGLSTALEIRDVILRKLQLPLLEPKQFALYRTEIGDSDLAHSPMIDDDTLLALCLQLGDDKGTVKFRVQPLANITEEPDVMQYDRPSFTKAATSPTFDALPKIPTDMSLQRSMTMEPSSDSSGTRLRSGQPFGWQTRRMLALGSTTPQKQTDYPHTHRPTESLSALSPLDNYQGRVGENMDRGVLSTHTPLSLQPSTPLLRSGTASKGGSIAARPLSAVIDRPHDHLWNDSAEPSTTNSRSGLPTYKPRASSYTSEVRPAWAMSNTSSSPVYPPVKANEPTVQTRPLPIPPSPSSVSTSSSLSAPSMAPRSAEYGGSSTPTYTTTSPSSSFLHGPISTHESISAKDETERMTSMQRLMSHIQLAQEQKPDHEQAFFNSFSDDSLGGTFAQPLDAATVMAPKQDTNTYRATASMANTPSRENTKPVLSVATQAHALTRSSSVLSQRGTGNWAFRPPAEELYEQLDDLFPRTDLDQPLSETFAPSPSSMSTEPRKSNTSLQRHESTSIRDIAQNRRKLLEKTVPGTTVVPFNDMQPAKDKEKLNRRRSTKLWGGRMVEMQNNGTESVGVVPAGGATLIAGDRRTYYAN